MVKARVMNASTKGEGSLISRLKIAVHKEGISFLFRGWTPAWIRLAPNVSIFDQQQDIVLICLDNHHVHDPGETAPSGQCCSGTEVIVSKCPSQSLS